MLFPPRLWPVLLLNILGTVSSAQVPFFGFQVGASMPLTQLKEDIGSRPAMQGTAFLFLDNYDGHVFKPRIDFVSFQEKDFRKDTLGANHPLKIDMASLGVDYNYFLTQKGGEGFYVLVGAQITQARTRWESPTGLLEKKKVGASVAAGVGMVFMPHIGVEARYSGGNAFARFKDTGELYDNGASSVTVSLVLLF